MAVDASAITMPGRVWTAEWRLWQPSLSSLSPLSVNIFRSPQSCWLLSSSKCVENRGGGFLQTDIFLPYLSRKHLYNYSLWMCAHCIWAVDVYFSPGMFYWSGRSLLQSFPWSNIIIPNLLIIHFFLDMLLKIFIFNKNIKNIFV